MKMRYATAKMVLLCLTANKDIRMEKMTGGGGMQGGGRAVAASKVEEWREQHQRSKRKCR